MNGIPQSWTIPTHLVMGSLLGPATLMRDLPLILTLMSLGISPKEQYTLWLFIHYDPMFCPHDQTTSF